MELLALIASGSNMMPGPVDVQGDSVGNVIE